MFYQVHILSFTKELCYSHVSILIQEWIGNIIHYKWHNEITYPFVNFNASVEVWQGDK